jgi:hypothetical protein
MTKICLDIGNVLVKANFTPFKRKLSQLLNISMEEALDFLNRTQKLHDLGFTRIADELRDHFKIRSQVIIEELMLYWDEVIDRYDIIFDFLDEISDKQQFEIALLSNIGFDHVRRLDQLFEYQGQTFNGSIKHFSCQVGARKPSLIYYQSFLHLYPEFQNALYIDDLQENLDASKQFNFRTYRFALDEITQENYDAKMEELKQFLLQS